MYAKILCCLIFFIATSLKASECSSSSEMNSSFEAYKSGSHFFVTIKGDLAKKIAREYDVNELPLTKLQLKHPLTVCRTLNGLFSCSNTERYSEHIVILDFINQSGVIYASKFIKSSSISSRHVEKDLFQNGVLKNIKLMTLRVLTFSRNRYKLKLLSAWNINDCQI